MLYIRTIVTILLCTIILSLAAQEKEKRALTIDDFARWETIKNPMISNNGKYVAYEIGPQKGDGKLVLYSDKSTVSFERGTGAEFGSENDFIVFKIKPTENEVREAKIKKVKKEEMPKDSLGIYIFNDNLVIKFAQLKSFKVADDNSSFVAFLLESSEAKKDSTENNENDNTKKVKQEGDDLVLFNIKNQDTTTFKNVTEYNWAKNGQALYFVRELKDSTSTNSIVFMFDTNTSKTIEFFNNNGFAKSIVSDDNADKYAFLFSADTTDQKEYSLYLGKKDADPEVIVNGFTRGIPVGWAPSEHGKIWFSEDGTKIYLGTALTPKPETKDTIPDDEKPELDIWNWKDVKLQPQQNVEAEKEKDRTYMAVYHIDLNRMIQLADVNIQDVSTIEKGNGKIGLGYNELPYLRESNWTGVDNKDYYLVDFESGIKREILNEQSYVRLSPKGKYVIWFNFADSSYYAKSTDINKLRTVSLTKKIPVSFYDELHDAPSDPDPYGIAGWDEDDRFVFIYDRYDIWKIDPSGEKVPVNVTKTFGRRNSTRLRYVKLDREEEFIATNESVILSAFDERTMSSGFFQTRFNVVKDPSLLIMDKFNFGTPGKAKDTDKIIWTKQSVSAYPNVWLSDVGFKHPVKISDANPWQDEYIWPTVELVEWESFSGEKLKGLLYKPGNFNASKEYPMMIYFYERSAETMYNYQLPAPSRSTINKALYTSNGYLVFVPDITYKTGYPGQSAYNAIVSGTQYLTTKFSFIDKKHIGLQGQSWGGYQTAYLITQTDMYAAAMAGAPVSNMTSAYGGIRWESGLSRMFQYEHTQSRIGGTLWDKPLSYIENSPLFYAPKVTTPLLIMHNDNDGAVPWYQGIELFVALRRLDKPVWMLSYNGEPHNLKAESWANRIDLSTRMFQFFNHYLKGQPAPEWMEEGISATEKGEKLGY